MNGNSTQPVLLHIDTSEKRKTWEALLKRLNEYKELLGLIVFIVGGMLWAFGYFATKSQFAELKCFSKNSIIVNRETVRLRDIDESVVEKSRRLEELVELQKLGNSTDKQKIERSRVERDLKKLEDSQKGLRESLSKAQSKLENSDCMGAEEK